MRRRRNVDEPQQEKWMRKLGIALAGSVILAASATNALALAAACTTWGHLRTASQDPQLNLNNPGISSCISDIKNATARGGFKTDTSGQDIYFWFGDNIVVARCASRTFVMMSAHQNKTEDACPLLQRVLKHLNLHTPD
jgi:hypothetical protein